MSSAEHRTGMQGALGVFALLAGLLWAAGPASAEIIYVENGGRVVAEAELFSSRNGSVKFWESIPDDLPNGSNDGPTLYQNARGGRFMEALPDGGGGGVGPATDTFIDYRVRISTTGEYRLYARWVGHNGQSDSYFGQVVELMDGTGGTHADWYEDTSRGNANFDSTGWDGSGGFEQNQATSSSNPMVWQINTPGDYTVRFRPREDGVSLDAFVLQLSAMSAPGRQVDRSPVVGELEAPVMLDAPLLGDTYVRLGEPTSNKGTEGNILVKNSGNTSSTTRKGYVEFGLPSFPVAYLLDAELTFQVSGNNEGGGSSTPINQTANVFALVEDVDHTWDESTLVWNGSPGNNTSVAGGDPLTGSAGANSDAIFLGQLLIPAVDPTQQDVFVSLSNLDTNNALLEYLLSDTDSEVSFFLTRVDGTGSWNLGFASKEHPTMAAPTLTLYIGVPEPTTLTLLGLGLAALGRRRRRK